MKKKLICLASIFLLTTSTGTFLSCEEDVESRGAKAAKEFCDCLDEHTESYCMDKLTDKYGKNVSDEFIEAFNEAQDCGATMYRKTDK